MMAESDTRAPISSGANSAVPLDRALACLLLRLALGLNIAMHGVTRFLLTGVSQFVKATTALFQNTPLPYWQVRAFATALPYLEFLVGVLLILGFWTRFALTAGSLLMLALIFGTAFRS